MSLGVVIKGPEGIVLAADSRVTLEARVPDGTRLPVYFDNATKLLTFSNPHNHLGAVTYGAAVIGNRTAHSFIPEFEVWLKRDEKVDSRLTVKEFAGKLSKFFKERWEEWERSAGIPAGSYPGPAMTFVVGGYDADAAYGTVFVFAIPREPEPQPRNSGPNDFGMTWGGQLEIASRIVHGFDPGLLGVLKTTLNLTDEQLEAVTRSLREQTEYRIPYAVLPLQDCVDLATFLIRATMSAQAMAIVVRGVGGPVEVATVTRTEGLKFVKRKVIQVEP